MTDSISYTQVFGAVLANIQPDHLEPLTGERVSTWGDVVIAVHNVLGNMRFNKQDELYMALNLRTTTLRLHSNEIGLVEAFGVTFHS